MTTSILRGVGMMVVIRRFLGSMRRKLYVCFIDNTKARPNITFLAVGYYFGHLCRIDGIEESCSSTMMYTSCMVETGTAAMNAFCRPQHETGAGALLMSPYQSLALSVSRFLTCSFLSFRLIRPASSLHCLSSIHSLNMYTCLSPES